MSIYIIKGNNGEMYDDYYEWIEEVFFDRRKAEKRVKELKKEARKDYKKDQLYEERQYKIEEYDVTE